MTFAFSESDNPNSSPEPDSMGARGASRPPRRRFPASPARRFRLAATLALAFAIALLWLAELSYRTLIEVAAERQNLRDHAVELALVIDDLNRAESAQRGFLLTHDAQYLAPFTPSVQRIATSIQQLNAGLPEAIRRASMLPQFFEQAARKLDEMALTLQLHAAGAPMAASELVTTNVGLERMGAFMNNANQLTRLIQDRVVSKQAEFNRLLNISRVAMMACVLATLVAFVLYLIQTARLNRATERERQWLRSQKEQLEMQVRERTERLTELASHLQGVVEDERARLARELHDEMGALMTAAKLDVARLRNHAAANTSDVDARLAHLTEMLNQGIALKRRIIETLHPSSLKNLGLVPALEILTREFQASSGLQVDADLQTVKLDERCDLAVYRVVQEALTNVAKYAQATRVQVALRRRPDGVVELSVVDDGVGFDATRLPLSVHGVSGMRHRLDACAGRLTINSGPGQGTRIVGELPAAACAQG